MYGKFRCFASAETSHFKVERQSANYQPSVWNNDFVQSLKCAYMDDPYKDRVKKLEEEVRRMIFHNKNMDVLATLEIVDHLQRLGLGYHFQKEIAETLEDFASSQGYNNEIIEKSLHATALSFRLLRQHGYKVSQDVFSSFKDRSGNFKQGLEKDVEGLLRLYEASYLAFEGESLLAEAMAFTRRHLEDLKSHESKGEQVRHALEVPLHHRTTRLEARWYIEAYGKREDANSVLVELAKLDFNVLQGVLQRDLQDVSRWWKDLGLANNLSFTRDRLMECFVWTVGIAFEPQFGHLRKELTKVTALITTIDDVYDVYGTLDDLELFTDAVERWDIDAVINLPPYMKLCFLALYNTVNEMVYDTLKEKGENILPYLTKAWADLCKAFLREAKWCYNKDIPSFKDYLDNGWLSVSGPLILVHAYFLVTTKFTDQALVGLEKYHDLLRWPSIKFRLYNDLSTSTAEVERGETANSIHCFKRETGFSEERARIHIIDIIERSWRKMNEERVFDHPFEEPFVEMSINLARIAQCTYQFGDEHGAPDIRAKNRVRALIIEPIPLTERDSSYSTSY
ncbi:putative terpene synthase 12 [Morella rubra]|uniref:Putative terpene synthase 12 n=1 Tax=Morella rubra TaxID=262757 RepID=A0A6A1VE33_9ROSI|nr:putative terpene synthase 12 [Morella rubra]